jgi:hypothetical protein
MMQHAALYHTATSALLYAISTNAQLPLLHMLQPTALCALLLTPLLPAFAPWQDACEDL